MTATTKGMFISDVLKQLKKARGKSAVEEVCAQLGVSPKFKALGDYPIETSVLIQVEVIKQVYPQKTVEEGMYELGKVAFDTFANSMAGKVMLTLFGRNIKQLAERIPKYYGMVNKFGSVKTRELEENGVILVYKDYREYPEHHHGIVETAVRSLAREGRVEMKVVRRLDSGQGRIEADFELIAHWQ